MKEQKIIKNTHYYHSVYSFIFLSVLI